MTTHRRQKKCLKCESTDVIDIEEGHLRVAICERVREGKLNLKNSRLLRYS